MTTIGLLGVYVCVCVCVCVYVCVCACVGVCACVSWKHNNNIGIVSWNSSSINSSSRCRIQLSLLLLLQFNKIPFNCHLGMFNGQYETSWTYHRSPDPWYIEDILSTRYKTLALLKWFTDAIIGQYCPIKFVVLSHVT